MIRCGVLFNCAEDIDKNTFNEYFNIKSVENICSKFYKLNIDYYLILEGEEQSIVEYISYLKEREDILNLEIINKRETKHPLIRGCFFQSLDLKTESDYPIIRMIYNIKLNPNRNVKLHKKILNYVSNEA